MEIEECQWGRGFSLLVSFPRFCTIPPKIRSLVVCVSDRGLMVYKFSDRVTDDLFCNVQGGKMSMDISTSYHGCNNPILVHTC